MRILREYTDSEDNLISVDVEPEYFDTEERIREILWKNHPNLIINIIHCNRIKIGNQTHKIEDIGIWKNVVDVQKIRRF